MKLVTAIAMLGCPSLAIADDDWTGFYAGLHVAASDADLSSGAARVSEVTEAYGVQVGYNHALANNWVVGGELSYSTAEYGKLGPLKDMDTTRLKLKVGYAFGATMAYGVLGYANIDSNAGSDGAATYGVGLGYKATDNIILNAEILRDSFDIKSAGVDADVTSLVLGVSYQF